MATRQHERLRPLTITEQRELRQITKGSSERVDRVRRATVLLAVAGGQAYSAAARAAGFRSGDGHVSRTAIQSGGAWGAADRGGRGRRRTYDAGGAGPDRGHRPAVSRPEGRWDGDLVAHHPGANAAARGAPACGRNDDSAGAARRGQFVSADADLVSDRDGAAQAQSRSGAGGRSEDGRKRGPSTWRTG